MFEVGDDDDDHDDGDAAAADDDDDEHDLDSVYIYIYIYHVYLLLLYYTCYLTCNMYVILYNKYILGVIYPEAILTLKPSSACTFLPLTSLAVLSPSVAIGMSLSKYNPPSQKKWGAGVGKGDLVDLGKMKKLAQRVEED